MKKYIFITAFFCCANIIAYAQADLAIAAEPIDAAIIASNLTSDHVDSAENNISTKGKILYGIASFYSKNLEGSKTSTGEKFHHKLMTAASNNYPLNTWVRVTNLRNNKSVIVRINDHMAVRMYEKGRVVDLSHAAASQLDFILLGIIKVKVEQVPEGTVE